MLSFLESRLGLQLRAVALNQSVLESRWKVVCAVSLTLLKLKAPAFQRNFSAGNPASGLSPCFKLRRIRDTV